MRWRLTVLILLFKTFLAGEIIDLSTYQFVEIKGDLTGVNLIFKGKVGDLLIIEGVEVFEYVEGETLSIFIRKESWGLFSKLGILRSNAKISIPRNIPYSLDLELRGSKADFKMEKTSPRSFRLVIGPGKARVLFDSPVLTEMEEFSISLSFGSVSIKKLGNANSQKTEIDCGAGKISIDLEGKWRRDSKIYLFSTLGSVTISTPPHIGLKIEKRGFLNMGKPVLRRGSPLITFEIEGPLNSFREVIQK